MPAQSDPARSMPVTIVIPARNAVPFLSEQLAAVLGQVRPSDEVVVVDDASGDGTAVVARSLLGDRMPERTRVITNPKSLGPSAARNLGAAVASNGYLVFCDADDVVLPGWLDALREALRQHDVVTGRLDALSLNDPAHVWARAWSKDDRLAYFADAIPLLRGGNCAIRADTFRDLGGFSPDWPIGQDLEFSLRCHRRGIPVAWVKDAVVAYRFRTTIGDLFRQARAHGRAKRRFVKLAASELGTSTPEPVWGVRSMMTSVRRLLRRRHRLRLVWLLGVALGTASAEWDVWAPTVPSRRG